MTGAEQPFRFVQFEFPWILGPEKGRYVLRDGRTEPPSHVLVVATLGAPERRRLARRRPRTAEPEPPPTPVPTTRATLIDAQPLAGDAAAAEWLSEVQDDAEAELERAVIVLNGVLHTHAIASADPLVREVRREHALVARLGWGRGEQVAEGRWADAVEVPLRASRRRRAESLRPQERLAAILGARQRPLAAELLALRARFDLDAGRDREAALQLRVALEAALAELDRERGGLGERVDELRGQREAVGAAANEALRGPLGDTTRESVEHALGRLEAAFRARAAEALDSSDPRPEG